MVFDRCGGFFWSYKGSHFSESTSSDLRLIDQSADSKKWADTQTQLQKERIKDEIKATQSLVSERKRMDDLVAEYDAVSSPEFLNKAKELASRFSFLRRVHGDGNCFYRALLFAQLERICTDKEECKRFSDLSKGWRERLLKLGFPDLTMCDTFYELCDQLTAGQSTSEELSSAFNNEAMSNYYVTFMRLVTSGYLKENKDLFQGFITGQRTVEEFCAIEVDPMFRECDHTAISALTQALEKFQ